MAVRLRLMRMGKTHRPFYRVCAFDARRARGGKYIESIGYYDPYAKDETRRVSIDAERASYWLGVGASSSETVGSFFRALKVEGAGSDPSKRGRNAGRKRKSAATKASPGARRPKPSKAVLERAKRKGARTAERKKARAKQAARAAAAAS